ncbi:hypothetical protein BD289DRAFT_110456 [Coniella lustricola]|uniref:Uncharacterized protein n=1 Tax=Coniella lustricola TaxID=2025994 RepID=A0A2T2ZXE7_9PEZI|nr:hypothetical protein BD289DRAFT_110456 [Coniella lustricola]
MHGSHFLFLLDCRLSLIHPRLLFPSSLHISSLSFYIAACTRASWCRNPHLSAEQPSNRCLLTQSKSSPFSLFSTERKDFHYPAIHGACPVLSSNWDRQHMRRIKVHHSFFGSSPLASTVLSTLIPVTRLFFHSPNISSCIGFDTDYNHGL